MAGTQVLRLSAVVRTQHLAAVIRNDRSANAAVAVNVNKADAPVYPGPYEAIPTFQDQELTTRGKLMSDNVNIREIYVSRVTNPSGGITVTIGV